MNHVPGPAQESDRPQSVAELRCRLNRRLSGFRQGWRRCDKPPCRRWKQCRGEGPDFTCTDDGRRGGRGARKKGRRIFRTSIKRSKGDARSAPPAPSRRTRIRRASCATSRARSRCAGAGVTLRRPPPQRRRRLRRGFIATNRGRTSPKRRSLRRRRWSGSTGPGMMMWRHRRRSRTGRASAGRGLHSCRGQGRDHESAFTNNTRHTRA
jgi:hypothetical protein